jgi:hypothetical protein
LFSRWPPGLHIRQANRSICRTVHCKAVDDSTIYHRCYLELGA